MPKICFGKSHVPLSPAVRAGDYIFISGQVPVDATGTVVVGGTVVVVVAATTGSSSSPEVRTTTVAATSTARHAASSAASARRLGRRECAGSLMPSLTV